MNEYWLNNSVRDYGFKVEVLLISERVAGAAASAQKPRPAQVPSPAFLQADTKVLPGQQRHGSLGHGSLGHGSLAILIGSLW